MTQAARNSRFWDRVARKYARDPIKDMTGYVRTLDRTRDLLRPSDAVLEIGCGTGSTALALAPSVARLVGTDLSGEMIAIAREKALAASCGNAEFSVASADGAEGDEKTFDAVLAFNLLHLVADRPAALRQALRLLKPGGLFISKTPCLAEMNPLLRVVVPIAQLLGKAPDVSFFKAQELEREVEAAGFAILERDRHGSGRKDPRIFIVARAPDRIKAQGREHESERQAMSA